MKPTCARTDCEQTTTGKSKYCRVHRDAARAAWLDKVRSSADTRAERDKAHSDLWERANAAGVEAATACVPTPMVVEQHANQLDDASPVVQSWTVPDGVCGFAWINLRPGNSSFAIWAKKHLRAHKSYHGGVDIWVSAYGQSMARKEAYATAVANVLRAAGINAYPNSRMD